MRPKPPAELLGLTLMEWAQVAQIAGVLLTLLIVIASLRTVRNARADRDIAERALAAQAVVRLARLPRGLFVDPGPVGLQKISPFRDAATASHNYFADDNGEMVATASVPVRNVGNAVAVITDVHFLPRTPGMTATRGAPGDPDRSALMPGEVGRLIMGVKEGEERFGMAESIGAEHADFDVTVTVADAAGRPRGTLTLQVTNSEGELYVTRDTWTTKSF